jgi:predicted RNA binding protein YcfA (HicA-like mRNA interferase family)
MFFALRYNKRMKVSEVLNLRKDDGWQVVVTRGSHRQLKHATKTGRVTVADKPSDDVQPGTLNSILKQAGLK